MTRPFTLRDWEATARPRVLCRVMKRQPAKEPFDGAYEEEEFRVAPHDPTRVFIVANGCNAGDVWSPIQPGDEVWYRESYAIISPGGYEWAVYKASDDAPDGISWRSPATMPRWASRRGAVCTDVRAVRVMDVPDEITGNWNWFNPKSPRSTNPWVWLYTMEEAAL